MIGVHYGMDKNRQPSKFIISGYVGEFKYFGFATVPEHCLACDGSEVSRETYNELFTVFGETFGAGDGTTTFNLPDFRGAFLRCIGGNAAALGTAQEDAIREIIGTLGFFPIYGQPSASGVCYGTGSAFEQYTYNAQTGNGVFLQSQSAKNPQGVRFRASRMVNTAEEVRPINYAVNICVVYE